MATLHVRNMPEDIYAKIQALATERKRSLSAEVITLLQTALEQEQIRKEQTKLLGEIRGR